MKEFFVGNYFLGIYYTFLLLFRWKINVEYVDFLDGVVCLNGV